MEELPSYFYFSFWEARDKTSDIVGNAPSSRPGFEFEHDLHWDPLDKPSHTVDFFNQQELENLHKHKYDQDKLFPDCFQFGEVLVNWWRLNLDQDQQVLSLVDTQHKGH